MNTAYWLYQMTFGKECRVGDGVLSSALNWIIDNMIMLCNVLRLWWCFGKKTAKAWTSAPSIQLRYAEPQVNVCPENCFVFSGAIYLSKSNRKSLFRHVPLRKSRRNWYLSPKLWRFSERHRHLSRRIWGHLKGIAFLISPQGAAVFAVKNLKL